MLYDRLAQLPLTIDGYRLERREQAVTSGFVRVTTLVVMEGGGHQGVGEDVTYTADDHDGFPLDLPVAGAASLPELSQALEGVALFAHEPEMPASVDYRRWAIESAALDLALRQAGLSLASAVGREARPVRFVLSTREQIDPWLEFDPSLEFKLDPEPSWDAELIDRLAATGRVRVLDLKSYYHGTAVDMEPDPVLYRTLAERFPDAVIEDAAVTGACREALSGALDRLSFDAPIHSLADVDALPVSPRWLNIKPSRFGPIRRLLECVEACEQRGIRMYGGGQFELGPGRSHIQALASVFYPDTANDVAPSAYNLGVPSDRAAAQPAARSHRRRAGLSLDQLERAVAAVGDHERGRQPGQVEDARHAGGGYRVDHAHERVARLLGARLGIQDHAQDRRVDEAGAGQVDDDGTVGGGKRGGQLGRRRQVVIAGRRNHADRSRLAGIHGGDIHHPRIAAAAGRLSRR